MTPVHLVRLPDLMRRGQGRPEVTVALIDGPVVLDHPDLAGSTIREIPGKLKGTCTLADSVACTHGTFVAGMLSARRGSVAPAICPGCTLLLRPIFAETAKGNGQMPSATPEELAEAIIDSVDAGARVINLSSALVRPSPKGESKLEEALNHAAQRGVITVAAAGNQGTVGSSAITRHPWVIPVAACDHSRQAAQRIESRKLHRQEGAERAGGERHQPRDKRQAADVWRDQRGGAFRDRRDRAALVGISRRHGGPSQAGRDTSRYAKAGNHRPARARCLGGLSSDGLRSQREKRVMNRKETAKNHTKEAEHQPHRVRLPGFLIERRSAWATPSSEPRTPWGSSPAAAVRSVPRRSTDGCISHGSLTVAAVGACPGRDRRPALAERRYNFK